MTRPARPTRDSDDHDELAWLQACYEALRDHVRAVHGLAVTGNANQIEAAHLRAHRAEGSAWHDAWRLPKPQHAAARGATR